MELMTLPEAAVGRRRPLVEMPGIRTLRSARFRTVLAATLLVVCATLLVGLLARQAADPDGQYGIDFFYWHQAARDVAAGVSPYPSRYLQGPVVGTDFGYKYPPTFAQSLLPLAGLPFLTAATVWAAVQAVLAYLAVWFGASAGGARPSLERALWTGVAATLYLPLWDSIWKGNVSAVQAFQVGLMLGGGAVAGAALASAVLLKTTPLALGPAALARGGRLLRVALVTGVVVLVSSSIASPAAWVDFVRIQANLLTGASVSPVNVHPASLVALAMPDAPVAAAAVRIATLLVGVVCVAVAVVVARKPDGWATAVTLGVVAMLLVPGSAWYHYLAVLLPLAAFAWPRGSVGHRALLLVAAASVTFGVAWLPLATIGATGLVVVVIHALGESRRHGAAPVRSRRLSELPAA